MKTSEVNTLLQRYYEGISTPEEELILVEYFSKEKVAPGLEPVKAQFESMACLRNEPVEMPEDLESSVLHSLKRFQQVSSGRKYRILYTILSAAAGVALLVSTIVFLTRQEQPATLDDPAKAYTESRMALEKVSEYLNRGTAALSGLDAINEAFEPLRGLESIDLAARKLGVLGKLDQALSVTGNFAKE